MVVRLCVVGARGRALLSAPCAVCGDADPLCLTAVQGAQPLLRGRYSILALANSHVRRTVVESDDYAVSAFAARSVFQFTHRHTTKLTLSRVSVCALRGCAQPRFSSTTDDRRRKRPETARGARPSRQPPFVPLSYIRYTSHLACGLLALGLTSHAIRWRYPSS